MTIITTTLLPMIVFIFSYMTGSISSAIIVCRLFSLPDPRTTGSQNPGATNVMRLGGRTAALLTLGGDVLKGLLPVLVVKFLGLTTLSISLAAFGAFLGHLYPLFFNFKGGKGVATALGVILGLKPMVALCALGVWFVVFAISKISSLSALTAALCAPLFLYLFQAPIPIVITVILIDLLLIIRHRANIGRLLRGEEGKINLKK